MANIKKKIENLKPGKEYIVTVRAKNADLNVVSDFADSIRFVVPQDQTIPNSIQNLQLKANFEKVMFIFDYSEDKDISRYEYELYNFNVATPPFLVSSGFNAANVFTISVANSYKEETTPGYGVFNQVNLSYWGRVRAIDTTGNAGAWTNLVQTDSNTPLISEEFIDSLTASKITAGTIGAATITLNGANSIIKSSTFDGTESPVGSGSYTGATTGWLINGQGKSYFYDATVVGSIDIGGFDSGSFHVDTTGNMWLGSGVFSSAPFRVSNDGALDINSSTPSQSFHIDKFGNMWSGSNVYGSASFRVNNQGALITSNITVTGGTWTGGIVGGLNTASDKIYITSSPVPFFGDPGTQFYVDNTGKMSLTDKFQWNGSTLSITGTITATTGSIGGWSIGQTSLTGGSATLSSTGVLTLGTSNDVAIISAAHPTYRIWAGHATPSSAPFSVTKTGTFTASDAIITGSISSSTITGGTIRTSANTGNGTTAGIILDSTSARFFNNSSGTPVTTISTVDGSITSTNGTFTGGIFRTSTNVGIGSPNAGAGVIFDSSGIRGFSGTGTASSFSLNTSGALLATDASITGTINASAGSIGGFTIASTLFAGSGSAFVGLNPAATPFFAGATSNTGTGALFSVTNTGRLTASNASITGTINANAGSIGGFSIGSTLFAGSGSAFVGLNPAATPFFAGATSNTGTGALFSVTNTGFLTSTSGRVGGWNIGSTSLTGTNVTLSSTGSLTLGSGNNVVVASSSDPTYALWAGNAAGASAPFSVTKLGAISATSGKVGGWDLSSNELFSGSGLTRVSFNSLTGVIAIGQGNHGSIDTGFYVDKTGKFSLSNQLIFNTAPSGTPTSFSFVGNVQSGSPTIASISAADIANLKNGMTVVGTGIASGSYITSVGVSSITLSFNATATNNGVALVAVVDDFAELQVVGRIKGVIESTSVIGSPRLSTSTVSITVSGTSPNQTARITTAGHAFITNEKILIENLPATNGLNNLNREFSISNVIDSITFEISLSGITGVTSTTTATTAGVITLRELTMGLHPAESIGTSYEHTQGTGIRLDRFNWWFTNNQFRVGTSGAYFSWNGSKFIIQGGGSKTLRMNVGSLDVDNYYSIVNIGSTPTFANSNTPFFADGSGRFSVADKLYYTGNLGSPTLTIDGTVIIGGTAASTIVSNSSTALQPGQAASDVNSNVTTISGGKIRTGSIQSTTYTYTAGNFSDSGMQINLDSAGYIRAKNFAIDGSGNAFFVGTVTASAGSIGGFTIGSTLSAGSGSAFVGLNPAATPFFAGATSNTGTGALFSVTNTGFLTSTSGRVGGWNIGSTSLTGTNVTLSSTGSLTLGSGNNVVVASSSDPTYALWAGNAAGASAPFSVTNTGTLSASNATISGAITANTGSIGGFTIGSTLFAGSGSAFVGLNPAATPFFAGATSNTGTGAKFSVTNSGIMTATNANITGGSIDFNSAVPANSFHINNSGQLWTGAADFTNAKFRVDNAGIVRIGSAASALYINNDGSINIGTALGSGPFQVSNAGAIQIGTSPNLFKISETGVVQIGNTGGTRLFIGNDGSINIGSSLGSGSFLVDAIGNITVGTNPNFFKITNAGRVSIGTNSSALYVDNDGSITIGSTWGTGLFKVSAAGQVDIGSTPPQSFHISPQGNVWAGADQSASPPFKLSNDGSIDIGGNDSTSVHISALGDVYAGTQKASLPVSAQYFITSITGTNTSEITISATPNHDFVTGQRITISGISATPAFSLNAIDQVVTVVNSGTFKIPNPMYSVITAVGAHGTLPNTRQYTTAGTHRFRVGHVVTISGITPSGYNGTYVITGIESANTFNITNNTTGTATFSNANAILQNVSRISGGVARRIPPFSLTASTGAVRASVVVSSDTVFGSSNHLNIANVLRIGSNVAIGQGTIYATSSYSSYDEGFNFRLNASEGFLGRIDTTDVISIGANAVHGLGYWSNLPVVVENGIYGNEFHRRTQAGVPLSGVTVISAGWADATNGGQLGKFSSAQRYKENISIISDEDLNPNKLLQLPVVQFKYRDGALISSDIRVGKTLPGFIAEEVNDIYPIACDKGIDGAIEGWNANIIIPPMLKLIQDLYKKIELLEDRLNQI